MKLRLTLLRSNSPATDIVVTADSTVTVGDVAAALERCDPTRSGAVHRSTEASLTLRVHPHGAHGGATVIPAESAIASSGIRSGVSVSLAAVTDRWRTPGADRGPAAATLLVRSGVDAGKEFPLQQGTAYIGRASDVDVRLSDPLVSKRHARITIGDTADIVDLGSANGVVVDGGRVQRAVLRPQDSVILGDTALSVTMHRTAAAVGSPDSADVDYNRSPRLDPTYVGETFVAPDPPELTQRQRFPVLAMVAPLIMGAVMYAFTRSALSVVFVALSPILMIGNYIDNKVTQRRTDRAATAQFNQAVAAMHADVARALVAERAGRLAEVPSTADAVDAMRRQTSLLWTRRGEHERFLRARLGVGTQPSRQTVELPSRNRTKAEHWSAVQGLASHGSAVDGVPVVLDLRECGAVGVAGPRSAATAVARGLVAQFVALHSPADLAVAAVVSGDDQAEWDWLKWLPHCGSAHFSLGAAPLASSVQTGTALVAELEELVEDRAPLSARGPQGRTPVLPTVLLIVQQGSAVEHARLVGLAERGPAAGVHVLWVATSQDQLPAACRDYLVVDPVSGTVTAGFVSSATGVTPLACETVDLGSAQAAARALAPVADASARVDDESDLPQSISLLTLIGQDLAADAEAVVERWRESVSITDREGREAPRRRPPGLQAVIGQGATAPFAVDLRSQGPHALVGGTTGAGKSEFLQAWVLGLATGYSPDALTFLFVDYKGGAAFADCIHLPHTVGLVTDLSPHLVQRALTSLNAELHHRERILQAKKAKDVLELQRRGDADAPPSLVIVVDEFAALVSEVPEFVDGVVNVAQRGRSLGLHLILATQRPAGVIKDNLRANTNLRIALRMADEDDSSDVLGSPVAAGFSPDIPGRAAAKTGPGRILSFQTGYAGGWTNDEPPPARLEIRELGFGEGRGWEEPEVGQVTSAPVDRGPTDIARLVSAMAKGAELAAIPAPRKPWLPDLAAVYDLQFLGQRRDSELVIGVVDDPRNQQQRAVFFNPDVDGNMAIYGTGGSGKSTALRTLAVAAGITPRSGPCHVYGLDFASGGLRMLEGLPHVGSIVAGDDAERVSRLITWLRELVDERSSRYSAARAGTITEYRGIGGDADEPRILVLVDGLAAFRETYEYQSHGALFSAFSQVAAAGRPVGVHIVVSADRPAVVPSALSSTIQRRLVLRLADENDYQFADVDPGALPAGSPAGRGVIDGLDVQVAVLGGRSNVAEQAKEIEKLSRTLVGRGVTPVRAIGRLPDRVTVDQLGPTESDTLPVGIAGDTLAPLTLRPAGYYVVAGPPGSGTRDVLAGISEALRRKGGCRLVLVPAHQSELVASIAWDLTISDPSDVDALSSTLSSSPALALIVEDIANLVGDPLENALLELCRSVGRSNGLVIAESETSSWSTYSDLLRLLRSSRQGLLIQPDQEDGDSLLRTSLPRVNRKDFPRCGGMFVRNGGAIRGQFVELG